MCYKLIALDLDGTLLNDDKKIPIENIDMLQKLYKLGKEILIVTGRKYYSAKELIKDLNINLLILANNGNIIRRISDDKILFENYLEFDLYKKIIEISKNIGLDPVVHVNHYEEGYDLILEYENNNPYSNKFDSRIKYYNNLTNYELNKALSICYFGDYNILNNFVNDYLLEKYKFNYHILTNLNINDSLLEIMSDKGSKWKTLLEYATKNGIKKEEIIAFGDDNNDLEMLMNAGLGICLKNAVSNVKEKCNYVSRYTNNESGVGKELKKIFNI